MPLNWAVLNESSFASVKVQLPRNARLNCESDAVVSMSDGVTVSGQMTGGVFSSMLRHLVSNESFFTTLVDNTSERTGDVLLAPSDPGGVCLHQLYGSGEDDMLLTSGSYLASDTTVNVTTIVQRGMKNSLFSGTGIFLMRASGSGVVALSSYGSIHKYTLLSGERRLVDNGHLVAWTAKMGLKTKLANSSVWGSMSSGEGLMCEFTGPGTIYLQSHKPIVKDGDHSKTNGSSKISFLIVLMMIVFFFFIGSIIMYLVLRSQVEADDFYTATSSRRQRTYPSGTGEF